MYPLSDGFFAPRNQWYVAAWGSEVTDAPFERWILDEPVALYRTRGGKAVALEGRCPHKSFPLGKSRTVGDNLQCGYHGITFRPDGTCASIPSQVAVPRACAVKSYPIIEAWRFVWIWMGDPEAADPGLLPDAAELDTFNRDYLFAGEGHTLIPARYTLLHDNLLDLTHVGYLHSPSTSSQSNSGDSALQNTVPYITKGKNWVSTMYIQRNIDIPLFSKEIGYAGKVDWFQGQKLFAPSLFLGGSAFTHTDESEEPGKPIGAEYNFHGITPARKHSTHYFFTIGQNWSADPKASMYLFNFFMDNVFPEDVYGVTSVEELLQQVQGRPSELLFRADAACVEGRRMIEEMIRAEM